MKSKMAKPGHSRRLGCRVDSRRSAGQTEDLDATWTQSCPSPHVEMGPQGRGCAGGRRSGRSGLPTETVPRRMAGPSCPAAAEPANRHFAGARARLTRSRLGPRHPDPWTGDRGLVGLRPRDVDVVARRPCLRTPTASHPARASGWMSVPTLSARSGGGRWTWRARPGSERHASCGLSVPQVAVSHRARAWQRRSHRWERSQAHTSRARPQAPDLGRARTLLNGAR